MENNKVLTGLKMALFAFIGIFVFFITITINGNTSIPLDHLVSFFTKIFSEYLKYYALIMILAGSIFPFYKKTWNSSTLDIVLSIFKVLGSILALMYFFKIGPSFLFEKDMLPFLFEKLVIPISLIVPIGAIFLSFLIDYGLLELVGVFMHPLMRKVWKTPGKSAIDAVASFVGSYSIGLLITGRVYKKGEYTAKEAAIIATGFSTVSVTFMIIVANTLQIMPFWSAFFWTTFVVAFLVTAITARLYPIKQMDHNPVDLDSDKIDKKGKSTFQFALDNGIEVFSKSGNVFENTKSNLKDGIFMTMSILASIMSIGTLGLILAKFTPFFKVLGLVFYPFVLLLQIPHPLEFSQAIASSLAEMFLPALMLVNASLEERFIGAIVCISSILFFSASIPCLIATGIPISIKQIVIIWFERVVLTLLLATPITYLLMHFNIIH